MDDAPLWLAQQKGLFAAAGLHVRIRQFGSDAAEIHAIEHGEAQIAAADYGNIFYQQSTTGDLNLLADAYDAGSGTAEILVGKGFAGTITSPGDLKGNTIGVPNDSDVPFSNPARAPVTGAQPAGVTQPNSVSLLSAAATRLAAAYLIGGADKLDWKAMTQQQEVAALHSGSLHAALLTEPYIYEAESLYGATSIMDVFSGPTATLPLTGYVATGSWVRSNPQAASDFQSAITQAQSQAAMVGTIQQELPSLPEGGFSTTAAKMVSVGTYPTSVSQNALERTELLLSTEYMLGPDKQFISSMLANS